MAPSTIETTELPQPIREKVITKATRVRQPLDSSSALDAYQSFDITPVIGREFPEVQLTSLLDGYNSDELLRDLAIIVSRRGVVFFRNQDITIEGQKVLGSKLGELSGKPLTTDFDGASGKRQSATSSWHSDRDIAFKPIPSDYTILKIVELPETGGDALWASGYEEFVKLLTTNKVHFKWRKNDVAIWDNRSTYHTDTLTSEVQGLDSGLLV